MDALYRMVYHFGESYDAIRAAANSILKKDMYEAGLSIGKFMWIIFFKK